MKKSYWWLVLLLLASTVLIWQTCPTKGYTRYQTFNQYKLRGEGTRNIQWPYVFVKESKDTIWVIKSNNRGVVMKYVNMGRYWYYQPEGKQEHYGKYYAKTFIVSDTMFLYVYTPEPGTKLGVSDEQIAIQTKDKITFIQPYTLNFDSQDNLYMQIKRVAATYKDCIPSFNYDKFKANGYPRHYYTTYLKVTKGEVQYWYDTQGTNKPICIHNARKLNSIGEFDLENAKDITSEIPQDQQCR